MKQQIVCALALTLSWVAVAAQAQSHYSADDFSHVRKLDAHVHANTDDHEFLDIARKDGFELLSINVDYPDFPTLAEQARVVMRAADAKHHRVQNLLWQSAWRAARFGWIPRRIKHQRSLANRLGGSLIRGPRFKTEHIADGKKCADEAPPIGKRTATTDQPVEDQHEMRGQFTLEIDRLIGRKRPHRADRGRCCT